MMHVNISNLVCFFVGKSEVDAEEGEKGAPYVVQRYGELRS